MSFEPIALVAATNEFNNVKPHIKNFVVDMCRSMRGAIFCQVRKHNVVNKAIFETSNGPQ